MSPETLFLVRYFPILADCLYVYIYCRNVSKTEHRFDENCFSSYKYAHNCVPWKDSSTTCVFSRNLERPKTVYHIFMIYGTLGLVRLRMVRGFTRPIVNLRNLTDSSGATACALTRYALSLTLGWSKSALNSTILRCQSTRLRPKGVGLGFDPLSMWSARRLTGQCTLRTRI